MTHSEDEEGQWEVRKGWLWNGGLAKCYLCQLLGDAYTSQTSVGAVCLALPDRYILRDSLARLLL